MKARGDPCPKCGKRANPSPPKPGESNPRRWMHCPRCGITFNNNSDNRTREQILADLPGARLADKYKGKR